MSDAQGNFLRSNNNITNRSGYGVADHPGLHASSVFLHGCGKRCDLRNENNGNDRSNSVIGASASLGIKGNDAIDSPPAFALGYHSLKEVKVNAHSKAKLGPICFRPPRPDKFNSDVYLKNSLTGLEKVTLKGVGGMEKIAFFMMTSNRE